MNFPLRVEIPLLKRTRMISTSSSSMAQYNVLSRATAPKYTVPKFRNFTPTIMSVQATLQCQCGHTALAIPCTLGISAMSSGVSELSSQTQTSYFPLRELPGKDLAFSLPP